MKKEINNIYKDRWVILFTVVMMTFMATLDSSIVNVALPEMQKKLSVSMASIEWVVTSYLIIIVATILIFGRLGDIKGKTKIFKIGIILFTLGSLLCGISRSLEILVIARIIQAIGAAETMATNQGIITQVFPNNERGRALGIYGTFIALGTMVGPPVGGFIISALNWNYIFLINVPIGIVTFLLALRILPKLENDNKEKLDFKGALLFTIGIVVLFGSITQGQDIGFINPLIILGLILALIVLAAFIHIEKRVNMPLLQLSIFENKLFSISIICGFISFIAIGSSNIILPFYLQDAQKLSPVVTGLFMMIYPIIMSIVAPASGYLSDKIGAEFLTFLGLLLTSIGLILMSTLTQNSSLLLMVAFLGIMSIGNGLFQSPNNSLVMSAVPKNKLGIAGSVNALVRNLGLVFGISVSTTLLYVSMSHKIGHYVTNYIPGRDDVFIFGMRIVYITMAIICALGATITAFRLLRSKQRV